MALNIRRLAVLSVVIAGAIAGGFAAGRGKPIGWFTCLERAGIGMLKVDARGEVSGIRFRPTDPAAVPIEAHWLIAWGPDGGTFDGDGSQQEHSATVARSMAVQVIDAAAHPSPHGFVGSAIARVNVTIEADCDGERGHAAFFTPPPELRDCRRTYELFPEQGQQCYRTWLSATLHRGTPAANAILERLFGGLDGGS